MKVEKGLLLHWWHYYGQKLYSLAELQIFEAIIDKYGVDKILEVAIASFICSDGSPTVILDSIRRNDVGDLIDSLPDVESMEASDREVYDRITEDFVKQISSTYNQN